MPRVVSEHVQTLRCRRRMKSCLREGAIWLRAGNFSASQLRSIVSEHFGSLALPVGEFLVRHLVLWLRGLRTLLGPYMVSCTLDCVAEAPSQAQLTSETATQK